MQHRTGQLTCNNTGHIMCSRHRDAGAVETPLQLAQYAGCAGRCTRPERRRKLMSGGRTTAVGAEMICVLLMFAGAASAQAIYPAKTIRLILPYAPGGSTSAVGRLIGHKLTESWHQQVLIDNRPGGGTMIGSEALVKSPPDGYTLLLVTSTHAINP